MFERYDEPARRVLFFSRYEATQLGSRSIETEHLLLGLIREMNSLAGPVLGALPRLDIRKELEEREHLLLGLLREEKSVAGAILAKHGLRLEAARQQVLELTMHPHSSAPSTATVRAREQVNDIMDRVQRLGLTLSDNPEAAITLALILEDLSGLKATLEGTP